MVNAFPSLRLTLLLAMTVLATALSACSNQPHYPPPPVSENDVTIPLATLEPDMPRFYTLQFNGRPVSFFVIKMSSGTQSYLDACVTCYPHKRGYACRDGRVVCRKCNMEFSIYKLEKGVGGCYPIKITGRTENGVYRIAVAELEKHAGKF